MADVVHELDPDATTPSGSNACRCGQKWPCTLSDEYKALLPLPARFLSGPPAPTRFGRAVGVRPEEQPSFVMVGWRRDGVCHLMLSDELVNAELSTPAQVHHFADVADMLRTMRPVSVLRATLHGRKTVSGPTWADCLAQLIFGPRKWRPDQENPSTEGSPT